MSHLRTDRGKVMRMPARLIALVAVAALAMGLVPTPALSLHKIPPSARLRNNGEVEQRGLAQGYCWPAHDGGMGCTVTDERKWQSAFGIGADQRMRIRFRKRAELRRVTIGAYRRVDDKGMPVGQRQELDPRIKPYKVDGEIIAWDAILELPEPGRHYYLSVFAYWRPGHVVYHFHARTRWTGHFNRYSHT
jgi:hypothetical protein